MRALWGVGPRTQQVLHRLGIRTVGQLAELDEATLTSVLGAAQGRHLHRLAHGVDDRPVVPDQRPKSISHEETYAEDLTDPARIAAEAVRMADAVAARLRSTGASARTVTIKVRFPDFRTITRSVTLPAPVDTGVDVARAAKDLLARVDVSPGVRLLGVGVSGLDATGAVQLSLDDLAEGGVPGRARWEGATGVLDAVRRRFGPDALHPSPAPCRPGRSPTVRRRFGPDALHPASLLGRGTKRRGEQQWGPGGAPGASGG